jgi:hypothetical protein
MELEPGPPLSHIVSAEVGCLAATNQKKIFVGYCPGTLTQPVYCAWLSRAVLQAPSGTLYVIEISGSKGENILVRFLPWVAANWAKHLVGTKEANRAKLSPRRLR